MSKEEIKYEISKMLDRFSDKALGELLDFLKELEAHPKSISYDNVLHKILAEDKELLTRLAQ